MHQFFFPGFDFCYNFAHFHPIAIILADLDSAGLENFFDIRYDTKFCGETARKQASRKRNENAVVNFFAAHSHHFFVTT